MTEQVQVHRIHCTAISPNRNTNTDTNTKTITFTNTMLGLNKYKYTGYTALQYQQIQSSDSEPPPLTEEQVHMAFYSLAIRN